MKHEPQWWLNVLWANKVHFALYTDVNTHNNHILATLNSHEYKTKTLHSPHATVWCSFIDSLLSALSFLQSAAQNLSRKQL